MKKPRTRHAVLGLGSLIVLAALWLTDPDQGNATGMYLLALAVGITAVAVAHLARKALFDYPEADLQRLFRRAGEAPTGAGLALVAVAIVLYGLLGIFGRAQAATPPGVPPAALQHLPTLAAETARLWPDLPMAAYPAGLIEHESCITLTHKRCWSATSRLKSAREEGAGLGQLTRAWRQGGALRFDALADLRAQHPAELAGLSWANVYQRPDLQMRALVLMSRGNWRALAAVRDPMQRLAMADAAYNGGLGGLQRERRSCAITPGCDPQRWWGHVEQHCLKSRVALYAGRSACDINRHHVVDVIKHRAPKYSALLA